MNKELTQEQRAGLRPWCPCGSGEYRTAEYDARGIFLCYVCDSCAATKLERYRPEVLTDPNYSYDEPIDEE